MGFDMNHIPNIESLPWEHFCSVCQLLINPNEALQSMCGHLYCKPCLAYVASTTMACPYDGYLVRETDAKPLMESNKVLAETIGKTVVYCLYQNSGCTWLGSLFDSSLHCSGCAFGNSLVICNWCGIQIAHRKWQEHVQSCLQMQQVDMHAYIPASVAMATSQASAQDHGIADATLTQERWYQQPYQQYYQNDVGYYMYQQPLHFPSSAPQHQVFYGQPEVHYVAQSHSQMQAQPQLQTQSLILDQPHTVFPSAPQAYPSVPPHLQHSSLTFPVSQGLQDLQAQAHFQTVPLSQAHCLQNAQVPPHQQLHGQIRSQLEIQNPMHPQANTVQNSPPQYTIGQSQSNQPHAYSTGQKMYHQPNQINQLGAPPNNMHMYHQFGTQTPQVKNHFPQQVSHAYPPQSLPTVQKQESLLPSQLTRTQFTKELVPKYREAPVPESSDIYSSQQPLPEPSLPQKHTTAPTTDDIVHNQTHQGGSFYNPHIDLQSHFCPIGLVQGSQKHQQTLQVQQPITPILGFQPQMNHHYDSASHVGSGQAAPSFQAVKEADMQRTQNQVPQASCGDKGAVEVARIKLDHDLKGTHIDVCAESPHRSKIVVEGNEIKSGPLGKQVMEGNVGNGRKNLGKSLLVEKKDTEDSLSLNGTPLLNPVLLEQDGLRHFNIVRQRYLMTSPLQDENLERSGVYSVGSLDRGFEQIPLVRAHEKHEPDFDLRPASSRFSQPSIDLGEGQFRCGPRCLVSEHGPLDHGLGGSRAETTDAEGRYRFGLLRSEFKDHGNLQMGEKVQNADMIGPVDSNSLRPGDVGFRSKNTLQGFHGDGGSFPGDLESFPNFRKRATNPVDDLYFHSHAKEHQPKYMDVKKLKMAPAFSSPFCNQNENEES